LFSKSLEELVERLHRFGPNLTLEDMAQVLKSANLSLSDVEPFVKSDPRSYQRYRIASADHFEALVMTWLPGQASSPHDHAGSKCVLQVLQGTAIESSFRIAEDGYIDLEYENSIATPGISAGQDAGIHAVRNSSDAAECLVTLHIYSPPLRQFRRFVERPIEQRHPVPPRESGHHVIIVGGGFSGSMVAAQVLRQAAESDVKLSLTLIERSGAIGEGIAYSTTDLHHLLNVPAGKMSAWPNAPDDFLNWVRRLKPDATATEFLPRRWYGQYVRETLIRAVQQTSPEVKFKIKFDEVRRIARIPGESWLVHLATGDSVRADTVVLAVGHRPPDDPIGNRWAGSRSRYVMNPWAPMSLNVISPQDNVVILGSGLTAVDTVLSLVDGPRSGTITMISRRGLFPQAHAELPITPIDLTVEVQDFLGNQSRSRLLELARSLRNKVSRIGNEGGDWRAVIDGLRPHLSVIWRSLSLDDRKRFLRFLRPYWEIHRHRMATQISAAFGELHDAGKIEFVAGQITSASAGNAHLDLIVEQRHSKHRLAISADWVINCTGPLPSNTSSGNPAIGSLLVDGWLKPDPLGLGIETTETGVALNVNHEPIDDLLVIGTLRKAMEWESTAVPELRVQAAQIARMVLNRVTSSPDVGSTVSR